MYTSVTQRDVCYFNQLPDYTFPPYSWTDPSFISLTIGNSPSILSALAPGQGSYFAPFSAATYVYNPFQSPQCVYQSNHEVDATGFAAVAPTITNISPSRGLIGATTSSVTITGQGLTGGSVNTPAAILVHNVSIPDDNHITLDLEVTSNATPGNNAGAISVTVSGQNTNAVDFFVQVPTSLAIVPGTASGTAEGLCAGGACGTIVAFKYQVGDQDSPSQPINASMSMWDSFGTFSPDNLNMSGTTFFTTCSPSNTNSGPCGVFTNTDGTFMEAALGACSTVCYVNGACTTGGPSGVPQTWHIAGYPIAQQISEYCEKILVNGTQVQ